MIDVTLHVQLHLEGPILTQSTGPGSLGVDALMARNPQGVAYLPYSHVKGRLLEACKNLEDLAPAAWNFKYADWFGSKAGNREDPLSSFDPSRTRLSFSDFREQNPIEPLSALRVRVKIDEDLGAAKEGMLAMLESAYAAGQPVTFAGQIRFLAATQQQADLVTGCLHHAFHWIHGYGAERTIGFGKCLGVQVTPQQVTVSVPSGSPAKPTNQLHYEFTATEPFCVTESRVGADNLFISSDVIPGGVLKGALASTWGQLLAKPGQPIALGFDPDRVQLCQHFSAIRFRHARPVPAGNSQLSIVPPLSFAKVGARDEGQTKIGTFRDIMRDENPTCSDGFPLTFAPDWKPADQKAVDKNFGRFRPATELRVRTAIDRATRRAASAQLFAYETVRPEGFRWCTTIDLEAVPATDRANVASQLSGLLAIGLRGVGKTKTFFQAQPTSAPPTPAIASRPSESQTFIVTLQTPCLLANATELIGQRDSRALHAAYQKAWHDLSGNSLSLVRFYAQQSLQGGLYLHQRFQAGNGKAYLPYLLTNAGSVFVLQGTAPAAAQCIERWQSTGLPIPAWAQDRYARNGQDGADWRNQPFVPENGFGEVAVNLEVHWNEPVNLTLEDETHV